MPTAASERLATPVRDFMRPGVISIAEHASLLDAKRAMVRHGVHAVLVVGEEEGRPLGWVSDSGLLAWLERDLTAIQASHAITEPARYIDPAGSAHEAIEALSAGASHLLVSARVGGPPLGVVAPLDLVDLVTHP